MEEDDGIPGGIATNSQCLKWKLQVFLFPLKGKKDIMTNFFASLKENLSFVLVCLVVTAALILAAELAERLVMKKRHRLISRCLSRRRSISSTSASCRS